MLHDTRDMLEFLKYSELVFKLLLRLTKQALYGVASRGCGDASGAPPEYPCCFWRPSGQCHISFCLGHIPVQPERFLHNAVPFEYLQSVVEGARETLVHRRPASDIRVLDGV